MRGMKPTVYIETSVISYLTSRPSRDVVVAGHQAVTAEWWAHELPKFRPVISPVVWREASEGDPEAVARRLAAIAHMPQLPVTAEMNALAVRYQELIRLPERALGDALHLAVAVWHGLDYLVSWNMRHIVHIQVREALALANRELGLATPVICTPEEMQEYRV